MTAKKTDVAFLQRYGYTVEEFDYCFVVSGLDMERTKMTSDELMSFAESLGWRGAPLAKRWINDNTEFWCLKSLGDNWQVLHHDLSLRRHSLTDEQLVDFARSKGHP
jgi:hypothetical protein